ncbi:putative leucine-rich repeat receptor-like protein kinase [Planoprotostelium fungivorum]|uniref:non-specific serine/threonine protein kinase n=1 Tax=Planoprotostelium fungivorum TaxID=1890364 RepID=A0A2P6N640_9EUKA|nr:putative leucine-rich repeat receptor-like protein kinase [Planoprotostelium fungivorum]
MDSRGISQHGTSIAHLCLPDEFGMGSWVVRQMALLRLDRAVLRTLTLRFLRFNYEQSRKGLAGAVRRRSNRAQMNSSAFFCLLLFAIVAADQLSALQSFYNQLGANWNDQTGWNGGTDACGFHGVTCTGDAVITYQFVQLKIGTDVTSIDLSNNGLSGDFPSDVWTDLSSLQTLLLPGNSITGTIPSSISNCVSLFYVDLSTNKMSGDIGNIGLLPNLKLLGLYSNQFSSISPSFCSLTGVWVINMGHNAFNSSIPSCMGQFTGLIALGMDNNQFTSIPSSFSNLVNLQTLMLNENHLNSPLTPLCGMTTLSMLDISDNDMSHALPDCNYTAMNIKTFKANDAGLTGQIPLTFGDMPLSIFQAARNNFVGVIPDSIFSPSIDTIALNNNNLNGPLPDRLMNCTQLKSIDISYNSITSIPTDLSLLVELETFNVELNFIQSEIPFIGNCTKLQKFWVPSNRFYGELTQDFSSLTVLNTFNIFSNDIEGEIPADFGLLSLTTLNLGDNRLTGQIPSSFINMTAVGTLVLTDNFLAGDIPSWLLTLPSLVDIDLSFNSFTGPIPVPSQTVRLQSVDLSKNKLSGAISQELSDQLEIVELNLEFNQLNGFLPSFYDGMEQLRLAGNAFSGTVPVSMINNTQLKWLDLSNNQLGGELPEVFGDMNSLFTLILSGNNFTGPIPSSLSAETMITLKMDLNSLSGPIPFNFAYMNNLITLDLSSNQLSGEIISSFYQFSKLRSLSLANNRFSGNTVWISNCKNLQQLDLSYNNLSGYIFDDQIISPAYKELVYLDISHNGFGGKILFQLPSSLVYFDASYNQFVDSYVPDKVSTVYARTFPSMVTCNIGYNQLRGYLLTLFTRDKFPFLNQLDLSGNKLIGPIPPSLGQLTQLNSLFLQDNQLTSDIPHFLGNLVQLTKINLGSNQLYSRDLSFLFKLNQLQMLNLSNNQIHASILDGIDGLIKLESFDVSHNRMYGQIPVSMYTMRVLTKLYVNDNNMTGNVSAFSADLREVDLSSNRFSGEAAVIDGLVSVTYLNLSHNSFSGVLPDISQKLKLKTIDLSFNQLTGSLPPLSALSKLEVLQMRSNELNGSLPSISRLSFLSVFDVSDNLLNDNLALGNLPSSLIQCNMSNNTFECPVTWPSISLCSADLRCTTGQNDSTVVVQIRVQGQVSDFNSTVFLESLSATSNTSLTRFTILSITSGSVITNVGISPAPNGSFEGSAMRRASMIAALAQTGSSIGSFLVLSPVIINPPTPSTTSPIASTSDQTYSQMINTPSPNANNNNNTNTGLIIGVVVGVACFIVIVIAIAGIVYARSRRSNSVWQSQLSMIGLKSINLGEAKSSITPFKELKNMVEIGSGAFGIVYKAEWRSLDVAVKQIRAEHVTQTQLTDFMGEVALLQRLRPHPHGSDVSARPSVSCEFCCICIILSLYAYRLHYLSKNDVSMEQKYRWIHGIALGMYHLHQEKVIHRDLAARNILLSKFLEAKVSDFGLSRETQTIDTVNIIQYLDDVLNGIQAAQTQTAVGPLKWMAPEAMRNRVYSQATDVFSFGVTVWEILTDQEPWTNISPVEAALKVITHGERMEIPDGVEFWLSKLIRDCWEEDPANRPLFPQICELMGGVIKVERLDDTSSTKEEVDRYCTVDNIYSKSAEYLNSPTSARHTIVASQQQGTEVEDTESEKHYSLL